jgi:hypothetical protein
MVPILFHGLSQLSLPVVCVESRQPTGAGWPRLRPGATRAQTLGMAALARSDRFFALHMAQAEAGKGRVRASRICPLEVL